MKLQYILFKLEALQVLSKYIIWICPGRISEEPRKPTATANGRPVMPRNSDRSTSEGSNASLYTWKLECTLL